MVASAMARDARRLSVAMDDALTWNTIAGKQYVRILEAAGEYDRQMEMYLFALAVRAVLRAETLARQIVEEAGLTDRLEILRLAQAGFDGLVPHAVQVRDILDH